MDINEIWTHAKEANEKVNALIKRVEILEKIISKSGGEIPPDEKPAKKVKHGNTKD